MTTLRELVREVYEAADTPDLDVITEKVLAEVSDHQAALHETLRMFVREVVASDRRKVPFAEPAKQGGSSSWKQDGIQQYHALLRMNVHTGSGVRKFMKDCTAPDLFFAEQERRKIARDNEAVARRFAAIRRLVLDHDVATVGDLPTEVLTAAIDAG